MMSHSALVKATAARRRRHNRLFLKHLTPQERLLSRHRKITLANEREHAARLAMEASATRQEPGDGDGPRPWRSVAQEINLEEIAAGVSEDVGPPTARLDATVRGGKRR
jgi:hypothetical protein